MPKPRKSKGKDQKQDKRIKALENLVYKTLENKQVNYALWGQAVSNAGFSTSSFLNLATGAEDGSALGDPARIGNQVTLLRQQFCMNVTASSTDTYNQIRVILVESVDGNQQMLPADVLQYSSYALNGNLIFASPYTTKTNTNKRYRIHMDKTFVLSGYQNKGGMSAAKTLKHVIRWKKGKVLDYSGPTSTQPVNHRLSLIVLSDSAAPSHPEINFSVRSTYKDA